MQQITESTKSMGTIVQDDLTFSGRTYSVARPLAAFSSDSLLPMDFLVTLKQNPPDRTSLIHAIILSDDRLVMAKSAEVNLRQSSIPFEDFKNNFLHQDVKMPNHIDHIHILSYDAKNRQMEFVSLHSQHLYLVAKTN